MANPGSRQYDTDRARMRKELEDRGVPDERANEQAKRVLRGDIARPEMENARPGRTGGPVSTDDRSGRRPTVETPRSGGASAGGDGGR